MMVRHAEVESKKKDMQRQFDPRADIVGPNDREEKGEIEERRGIDHEGAAQRGSAGTNPEDSRIRRRGPGP
jgi:hypothetical protein